MGSTNVCWGVEIGAGAVKAVKLEKTSDGVRVIDFAIVPHAKVLSTPDIDQKEAIRVALSTLTHRVDLSKASIAVSVPGHSAFARFAKLPPVEPKKVPDIVKFEAVQQIPFSLDEVEWDYQTFASHDSPEIEVGIFAMRSEQIKEQMTLYEGAGLVPDVVTLSPVAAYNALAYDLEFSETTEGTIILDIGTTSTDLIIAEAGRVWIRTFPIGGHHFTEALVAKFDLPYSKAEKLKREASSSKHAKHVFQAMQPVYADLAQDVQRSIGYYQSLHKDAKLTRLIGLGSTFSLPGMRRYLKQQLDLNVYKLDGFKRAQLDDIEDQNFQNAAGNLATAFGLALQGLDYAALRANLMPVEVIRRAMWKRKVGWFGMAAGVAIATGSVMFLRPVTDRIQVESNQPSPEIQRVANDARRLKNEAMAVTDSSPASYLAPNLKSLTTWRDIYPHIVNDVGLLIESANTFQGAEGQPGEEQTGPAFYLEGLDIRYRGKSGTKIKREHAAYVFGTASFFDEIMQEFEAEEEGDPLAPVSTRRIIQVNLTLKTSMGDSQVLMSRTIDRWLRNNSVREGVPYRIVANSQGAWVVSNIEKGSASTSGGGGVIETPPSTLESRFAGGNPTLDSGTVIVGGRGSSESEPVNVFSDLGRHSAELGLIAPLPSLAPLHDSALDLLTYRVTWTIEILDGTDGQEGS